MAKSAPRKKVSLPRYDEKTMARGTSTEPLSPGDVVVSDDRVPPFYRDETLIVDEIKNIGTRGNPYWRVLARSPRGVTGWLDATSVVRL